VDQLGKIADINPHVLVDLKHMLDIQELQITHAEGNKRHGVHELLKLLRINKAQVMAIGDGNNDLPLFESAALKIAVANASEALKAAADHVVASVDDNGFAEAVERFVLGMAPSEVP
jgi:hydroxymethylpyrimidine pyrophosphatase-like HAD family hydrolase